MSRTKQASIKENPCKKFLTYKTLKDTIDVEGEPIEKIRGGGFVYWDKSKGEKGENVVIPLPLKFAILNEDLVTFKGYDEARKRGVYSNEVSEKNHVVTLKSKTDVLLKFPLELYKENKDKLKGFGAKYTKSIYIAVDVNGTYEIWNLQLGGAPLSGSPVDAKNQTAEEKEEGWFNFVKNNRNKLYSNFIEIKDYKMKKKGINKYTIPVFTVGEENSEADLEKFKELDAQLNEYLDFYFQRDPNEPKKEAHAEADDTDDDTDY